MILEASKGTLESEWFKVEKIPQLAFYHNVIVKNINRKKILSFDFLKDKVGFNQKGSGGPGKLFQFNKANYDGLISKRFHFEIKYA